MKYSNRNSKSKFSSLKLNRIDHFSHYQVLDQENALLLDKVEAIGKTDEGFLFKTESVAINIK